MFDAIFTLKNTGRASMDGARHDFAKSAAGLGLEPRFTDSESVCLPVSRSRKKRDLNSQISPHSDHAANHPYSYTKNR